MGQTKQKRAPRCILGSYIFQSKGHAQKVVQGYLVPDPEVKKEPKDETWKFWGVGSQKMFAYTV